MLYQLSYLAARGTEYRTPPLSLVGGSASAEVASAIAKESDRATELGISSTPTLLIGKTGGELRRIELESLDAEALFPVIDEELGSAS